MSPNIIAKDAFLVAGVAGNGAETGSCWEAFMRLDKLSPLPNKAGEEMYEVRLYTAQGPVRIHVGMRVKDAGVPVDYGIFCVPAAVYAEFEIHPVKGYQSSNAEINRWLAENTGMYGEALTEGVHYAVEVYDRRYKGDQDPTSVVGIWVPIVPVAGSD